MRLMSANIWPIWAELWPIFANINQKLATIGQNRSAKFAPTTFGHLWDNCGGRRDLRGSLGHAASNVGEMFA